MFKCLHNLERGIEELLTLLLLLHMQTSFLGLLLALACKNIEKQRTSHLVENHTDNYLIFKLTQSNHYHGGFVVKGEVQ